ncbi:S-adenosyl-L-methionine-dependent methyltransferase [Micromonospora humidisoli]|uniref:S-adenosyl-L-methionine-dependent methyltransferase n=1 Tax=Micromonospora humidisoli TaxID=2807622 RepID=A0ABS2JJL4_9ACTN|nr:MULTISPECIES: SAM-dependent methyltransferase [Micromonospora]MBM7086682.1 SAM-dependent methyltransferase [Micromonospora humidisoli]GHJ11305.1 S-adenosyl-L-methionine-dependent methyltransferase [Micromonospora sp. AKA109]
MDQISYTAQWTAAARAQETERPDGIVRDEYARQLAEPRGFELLEHYRGAGVVDFVAVRTRYIDDALVRLLAETGIQQVVMLANGMDVRTHRLRWPPGVTVYEVDHDALLDEKQRRLAELDAEPQVNIVSIGADLAGDWLTVLTSAGFVPDERTLWIAEGLIFFLTEAQAGRLLRGVAGASQPGSRLVLDLASAALLRHPMTQSFLQRLRDDGTPWQFGTDHPAEFLAAHGWTVRDLRQPGEPGAGEGRWPYPVAPREARGVPRSWLVSADLS